MTDVEAALRYVDDHAERFVEDWRDACRFASYRGSPELPAMAAWVIERAGRVLDSVDAVPTPAGPPAIVGALAGRGPGRLLIYSHYDVQPADVADGWDVSPFAAEIRQGRLVARGCCDDKADLVGRLHALEAWTRTVGPLPFSVVWLCEGAEESGSAGIADVISAREELLRSCDWCLWESYLRRDDGRPEIGHGCRGLLYVELALRRLRNDQHSAFASIYRSAAADLVAALSSLRDADGRVAIEGFHDSIADETPLEQAARQALEPPADDAGWNEATGFLVADEEELARRLLYAPTANIAGLSAGYTGSGAKTVLPAEARAKVDFRLVPDQTPERALELLRAHLDRHGFGDVEIEVLSAVPPARSPMDSAIARAATAVAARMFGDPVIYPWVTGSGPVHHFSGTLGIPTVMPPGATRLTSNIHGPNENAAVEDFLDVTRFTIGLLEELATARSAGSV
ncbi:MAG TPA: M20/M25/M40 family metallo-hydrolase [Gaiellaceae bacterium]|nr:M20/M25/M40 family metallo-hydrolase [Gaiellaceae bacterium]